MTFIRTIFILLVILDLLVASTVVAKNNSERVKKAQLGYLTENRKNYKKYSQECDGFKRGGDSI